jgi:hypothetical protein
METRLTESHWLFTTLFRMVSIEKNSLKCFFSMVEGVPETFNAFILFPVLKYVFNHGGK